MGNKGKQNAYICPDLHITVTVDTDEGVTPMIINCPECGKNAVSRMYMITQGKFEPTHEWYEPKDKKSIPKHMRDHVEQGGLLFRKIEK